MLCELETVANFFDVSYGLRDYKTNLYQWNSSDLLAQARNSVIVNPNLSIQEFHLILLQYCLSTRDYHVGITFAATESAILPISIKEASDRYFLMDDKTKLAVAEIIRFNGIPIHTVVESLQQRFFNYSNAKTDRALALAILTNRQASMGIPVPQGVVSLELNVNDQLFTVEKEWVYEPERICFSIVPNKGKDHKWTKHECMTPYFYKVKDSQIFAAQDSFVPTLGKKTWTASGGASNPFSGGIYTLESGEPIGYIRIPHYTGDANDAELFRQTIEHLQKKTKALVIDQTGNPGGYPLYLMALASALISKPIDNILESTLLNHNEVLEAHNEVKELSEKNALTAYRKEAMGYPLSQKDIGYLKNYYLSMVQDWKEGKVFSDLLPMYGIPKIKPHPQVNYTKPIIVLTDEACFSGGDILPALLQDNHRALIFGQTTAGAGGSVESYSFPNHFGVESIDITRSVLYRTNGLPLENLGVTPDIIYEITVEDLKDGYKGYKAALIEAIKMIINTN